MQVIQYKLNEYYHNLITIEADDLTETLKDVIDVHEDDCYALCSSFCDEDGSLMFAVFSIGPSWEECTNGFDREEILGVWSMEQVALRNARLVEPDMRMIQKNAGFLVQVEKDVDDDQMFLRTDNRLDNLRDPEFPDIVSVGILQKNGVEEYDVLLTATDGPFLLGKLCEDVPGHEMDEVVYAMPFIYGEEMRLVALGIGDNLSDKQADIMHKIRELSQSYGVSYRGNQLRS